MFARKNITKENIEKAELVLVDNGIEASEAQTVLQAIGYALLDTELYPGVGADEANFDELFAELPDSLKGRPVPMQAYAALLKQLSNEFAIYIYDERDVEKGIELEMWTNGGVDMFTFIDFRDDLSEKCNPYRLVELFRKYVDEFEVDEEIHTHMEDQRYRNDFTYEKAVEDFTDYHNTLNGYANKLESTLAELECRLMLTREMCEDAEEFSLRDLRKLV